MANINDLPDEVLLLIFQELHRLCGHPSLCYSVTNATATCPRFLRVTFDIYWQECKIAYAICGDIKHCYGHWRAFVKEDSAHG